METKIKNKAFIKAVILRNMKLSIDCAIDRLIEQTEADEKYQSPELTKDFFNIQAKNEFNALLLSELAGNIKQVTHVAKQMN